MEFLTRKAQEFVELSPDVDIFQVIGQGISEIIPDALITVNSIDEQSGTLTIRAVLPERDQESLKRNGLFESGSQGIVQGPGTSHLG
jgi:hypothetical protein